MTSDRSIAMAGSAAGVRNLPGIRTLRSPRFRVLLGALLLAVGATMLTALLVRQASLPDGQFAIDLDAYVAAAQRLTSGQPLYGALADGRLIAAQGAGNYLYPPMLAQVLAPVAGLPFGVISFMWAVAQVLEIVAAVLLGLRLGLRRVSARPSASAALWACAATVWFLPGFDAVWKGNVSGFLALTVAMFAAPGRLGGALAALSALVKVAPLTFLPAALAANRRRAVWALLFLGGALVASVLLSPQAWTDYARVLPSLFAGDATQPNNLSPWAVALHLGLPAPVPGLLRLVSLAAAVAFALAAVPVARRPGGLSFATLLAAVAMLLAPAQLWYHYLVVLLPLAAMAWPRSTSRGRVALALSGAAVTLGIAWLPIATAGAIAMIVAIAGGLRPAPDAGLEAAGKAARP